MASKPSRVVKLCGTEEVDPPSRTLAVGSLSVEFENGALRYVRIAGVEVIRGIAFLVRDENWGTFTPTLSALEIEEEEDRFTVTYVATCKDAKRTLVYDARIEGKSDGSLRFEATAEPITDVVTNRTGFVVLHPIEGVAGRNVKVLHADGREVASTFPTVIDPMQPFFDIRALSHEITPGFWATCRMEGDTWEMEDQRNWTDASYKTFVRPLSLPWPYILKKGIKLSQSVSITLSGNPCALPAGKSGDELTVEIGSETGTAMPVIGIGVPADEAEFAAARIEHLQRLGSKWLVCEFDLRKPPGRGELDAYGRLGAATGADIVLELVIPGLDPVAELAAVAETVQAAGLKLDAIAVSPAADLMSVLPGSKWPTVAPAEAIYAAARAAFPGIKLGGGMFSYFTELNRKRPPAELLDYVSHTTCPIVHAADDRSVMETLEALPFVTLSTRAFIGDTAYRVGPSAIGCRHNPYGKVTTPNLENGRVCLTRFDPRQRGLFNAAWTLGYVAALTRGGVEAIAMGAPTGPFGFIHRESDFAQPYFDDLDAPAIYPAFHVMAGLARASHRPTVATSLSKRGLVEAIAFRDDHGTTLWVANLTSAPRTCRISGLPQSKVRAAILDADSFELATTDPAMLDAAGEIDLAQALTLDAYAVARLEFRDRVVRAQRL